MLSALHAFEVCSRSVCSMQQRPRHQAPQLQVVHGFQFSIAGPGALAAGSSGNPGVNNVISYYT